MPSLIICGGLEILALTVCVSLRVWCGHPWVEIVLVAKDLPTICLCWVSVLAYYGSPAPDRLVAELMFARHYKLEPDIALAKDMLIRQLVNPFYAEEFSLLDSLRGSDVTRSQEFQSETMPFSFIVSKELVG